MSLKSQNCALSSGCTRRFIVSAMVSRAGANACSSATTFWASAVARL